MYFSEKDIQAYLDTNSEEKNQNSNKIFFFFFTPVPRISIIRNSSNKCTTLIYYMNYIIT